MFALDPKKTILSILLGLGGFFFSLYSFNYMVDSFTVSLAWNSTLPLLAGLAFGARYGFIAGTLGLGCLFPFMLWPTNGWANISTALIYLLFYTWHGYFANKREILMRWYYHPLIINIPYLALFSISILTVYPVLYSFNPPPWSPKAETTIPAAILNSILMKEIIIMNLLIIFNISLLKINSFRRLLGLQVKDESRNNGKIFIASILGSFLLWGIMAVFNHIYIDQNFPAGLIHQLDPRETISLIVLMFAGFFISYIISNHMESRLRSENLLRENIQSTREILECLPVPVAMMDLNGSLLYFNKIFIEKYGYSLDDVPTTKEWYENAYPDEEYRTRLSSKWERDIMNSLRTKSEISPREAVIHCKDGTYRTALVTTTVVQNQILTVFSDITEHKHVEAQLKESERKYRRLHESMIDGFVITDMDGVIIDCNKSFLDMLGYTFDEITKLSYTDITPSQWHEKELTIINEQIKQYGFSSVYEKEYTRKDGVVFPVELRTYIMDDESGENEIMWAIVRDISKRKTMEHQLRRSEEIYSSIFRSSPNLIMLVDAETMVIEDVNESVIKLSGYSWEEFIGHTTQELGIWPTAGERNDYVNLVRTQRYIKDIEVKLISKSGEVKTILLSSEIIKPYQEKNYILNVASDITDRKNAEETLQSSLKEKEVLLRELYHRTKNNMQVICSLMHLQSAKLHNEAVSRIFLEIENKIQSMALVHKKLYQSHNLSNINMRDYIMDLTNILSQSYHVEPDLITFDFDLENISADIENAIPCGLVLNELISNSMKHAFTDGRKGSLKISLHQTGTDSITMVVSDNGPGFSPDAKINDLSTMGLQTIFAIARDQLGGTVTFNGDHGTSCTIVFHNWGKNHTV